MGKKFEKSKQEQNRSLIKLCFDKGMEASEIIAKVIGKKSAVYRVKKKISKRKSTKRKRGSKGAKKLLRSHKLKIFNALKKIPFCQLLTLRIN